MRMLTRRLPWLTWALVTALAVPQAPVVTAQQKQPAAVTPPPQTQPATHAPSFTDQTRHTGDAQPNPPRRHPPPGTNADTGWPRTVALKTGTVVWYQPQVESWT
jgi:hypothetical protein